MLRLKIDDGSGGGSGPVEVPEGILAVLCYAKSVAWTNCVISPGI